MPALEYMGVQGAVNTAHIHLQSLSSTFETFVLQIRSHLYGNWAWILLEEKRDFRFHSTGPHCSLCHPACVYFSKETAFEVLREGQGSITNIEKQATCWLEHRSFVRINKFLEPVDTSVLSR